MKETELLHLENQLKPVPDKKISVRRYSFQTNTPAFLTSQLESRTDGKGRLDLFCPLPGVEMALCQFKGKEIAFRHEPLERTLEINHCHLGRCGWDMHGGMSTHLGPGDLSIHSMACCGDSRMSMPLEYYEGISIAIDLELLETNLSPLLKEAGVSPGILYDKFCAAKKTFAFPACVEMERLFSILYHAPTAMLPAYYALKAQELLLFLTQLEPAHRPNLNQYQSQQVEMIKEIHSLLTENLEKRFTIEELAKKYPLNTTTLKHVFKTVYGQPIAAYMKAYRIKEGSRLLRETDYSISKIASLVGYESQGKFAKAFRDELHVLPTEYRKQH